MTTDTERPERCQDTLADDGSVYRCTLPIAHSGPHQNGDWEWWDYSPVSESKPPAAGSGPVCVKCGAPEPHPLHREPQTFDSITRHKFTVQAPETAEHAVPSKCPTCRSDERRVYHWPCDDGTLSYPIRNAHAWHGWKNDPWDDGIDLISQEVPPQSAADQFVEQWFKEHQKNPLCTLAAMCEAYAAERVAALSKELEFVRRECRAKEDALLRFEALNVHLPEGFAIGDDATAELALELTQAEADLAEARREIERLNGLLLNGGSVKLS